MPENSRANVAKVATRLPMWRRIYRFGARWMVHVWLGMPLLGGVCGSLVSSSQYADVYDVAIKAQSFWHEGVITRPDLRGDHLRLAMANGERHEIRCFMRKTMGSSCLFGRDFPIKARVELFDYKGAWMIFTVRDLDANTDLVTKSKQLERYKWNSAYDATLTPEHNFRFGIWLGIATIPFGIFFTFMMRRKERILAQRRAANAE